MGPRFHYAPQQSPSYEQRDARSEGGGPKRLRGILNIITTNVIKKTMMNKFTNSLTIPEPKFSRMLFGGAFYRRWFGVERCAFCEPALTR